MIWLLILALFLFLLVSGRVSPVFASVFCLLLALCLICIRHSSLIEFFLAKNGSTIEMEGTLIGEDIGSGNSEDSIKDVSSIRDTVLSSETEKPSLIEKKGNRVKADYGKYAFVKFSVAGVTDPSVSEAISKGTGFTLARKGDHVFKFSHSGRFEQALNSGSEIQEWVFIGGDLIIEIDDETCCCMGLPKIPKGMPSTKYKEAVQKIEEEMVRLFQINEQEIMSRLRGCLPYDY